MKPIRWCRIHPVRMKAGMKAQSAHWGISDTKAIIKFSLCKFSWHGYLDVLSPRPRFWRPGTSPGLTCLSDLGASKWSVTFIYLFFLNLSLKRKSQGKWINFSADSSHQSVSSLITIYFRKDNVLPWQSQMPRFGITLLYGASNWLQHRNIYFRLSLFEKKGTCCYPLYWGLFEQLVPDAPVYRQAHSPKGENT